MTNILIYGGAIIGILGLLNIIRFDGSIKRVIICGIMIVVGLASVIWGVSRKKAEDSSSQKAGIEWRIGDA